MLPSATDKQALAPAFQGTSENKAYFNASFWTVLAVLCITAFGAYWSSLSVGFLLDDYSHLHYAYLGSHGDWSELTRVFTGGWTGAVDDLTAYRPFICLSYCIDYLFWGVNSVGYHLSNLAMFAGCTALTSLIAFELTAFLGKWSRLAIMAATGLLFVTYPLHPEAVAWVIGRVDVQCGLWCFASIYSYILSRRMNRRVLKLVSLACFGVALPSKEMSVTVPAILSMLEFLAPSEALGWRRLTLKTRLTNLATFWALLAVFAAWRTLAIGTVIGGYGHTSLKTTLQSFRNFLDGATWSKVLFGVNEEMQFPQGLMAAGRSLWFVFLGLFMARIVEKSAYWRTLLFLTLWTIVTELPTFQIWHVWPNLSGSRLLFIPSAPMCILMSFIALPAFSVLTILKLPRQASYVPSIIGGAAVVVLACLWNVALLTNLQVWTDAGNRMKVLTQQIRDEAAALPSERVALLLDLPQDHSGSGLVGRPEFLERLLRPPHTVTDLNSKIVTAERAITAGSHEFAQPRQIKKMIGENAVAATYIYSEKQQRYVDWASPAGLHEYVWNHPIMQGASEILWLPEAMLDPFHAQAIRVHIANNASEPKLASNIQLVWRSENQPESWIDYSQGPTGEQIGDEIVFLPGRYRSWLLNGSVKQVGFKFSTDKPSMRTITADDGTSLFPRLELISPMVDNATRADWVQELAPGHSITAAYDFHRIPGAFTAKLIVAQPGIAPFDSPISIDPGEKMTSVAFDLKDQRGAISINHDDIKSKGMHEVAVLALDGFGKPIGFASEPRVIKVK